MSVSYKHIVISVFAVLVSWLPSSAQNVTALSDSVVYRAASRMDSTLVGKSIFSLLPSGENGNRGEVRVHQSQSILNALQKQIASNSSRNITGYRVRIFNDNKQTARGSSEAAVARFRSLYPGIPAYRTYTSPFFKVTVGDFRSKSEAMWLFQQLTATFPSAFIVKEVINFPSVDNNNSYVAETVTKEN